MPYARYPKLWPHTRRFQTMNVWNVENPWRFSAQCLKSSYFGIPLPAINMTICISLLDLLYGTEEMKTRIMDVQPLVTFLVTSLANACPWDLCGYNPSMIHKQGLSPFSQARLNHSSLLPKSMEVGAKSIRTSHLVRCFFSSNAGS